MPVYPITTGIFAKAPHPNAAKLFLAFAISKEQQQRTAASGAIPVRPDVGPAAGLKPLSSYRITDGYINFISNQTRTKELRQRFEGYIGPPQGAYISTLAQRVVEIVASVLMKKSCTTTCSDPMS